MRVNKSTRYLGSSLQRKYEKEVKSMYLKTTNYPELRHHFISQSAVTSHCRFAYVLQ